MFAVVVLCMGLTFTLVARYLLATRALVARVQEVHNAFWREELGACRWVRRDRHPGPFEWRISFYLEPVWPYLRWLLRGEATSLDADTAALHARARRSLIWGTASLLVTMLAMLVLQGLV